MDALLVHVDRTQDKNFSVSGEYEARVIGHSQSDHLSITFHTDQGSRYRIVIGPKQFGDLARAMLRANQVEAIRGFGAALQEIPDALKTPKDAGA